MFVYVNGLVHDDNPTKRQRTNAPNARLQQAIAFKVIKEMGTMFHLESK